MKTFAKVLGILVVLAVVVGAGLLAWGWYEVRANGARTREAFVRELERIRPAFLEDQELAKQFPILGPQGNQRDAGPFLNPRIGWDGKRADIDRWLASLPERRKPLALEKALADRIPDEWWTAERSLWAGLDFSWMADLQRFEHWDVEKNSPWPAIGATLWPNGFPLFFDMTPWVKLRLAKGVAERHVGEAVTEVEHLATLLLSTETLVGAATALQYLGFVDQVLALPPEPGQRLIASTKRMDATTRRRVYRAIMAAQDFLRVETPPTLRRVEPDIMLGRCAAMNEALHAAAAMRALQRAEDASSLRALEDLMKREKGCRMSWVRAAWSEPAPSDPQLLEGRCDEATWTGRWVCHAVKALPFARAAERRLAQEVLGQIMLANYVRHPGYP